MNYTMMIGNGFDVGLGLKTRYSDFICQYVDLHLPHDPNDIETILKGKIKRDIETWSDAERAFAELPFGDMLANHGDFNRCLLELLTRFKSALTGYISKEESKLKSKKFDDDVRLEFFGQIISSLFAGMPEWIKKDELAELTFEGDRAAGYNEINFVNFNYTNTFDSLIGIEASLEPHYEFDDAKKRLIDVKIEDSPLTFDLQELVHVHGSFFSHNVLFGISDLRQIKDESTRYFSELIGYLIKSRTDVEIGNGIYERVNDFLDNSQRVIVFGLSMGVSDGYWWKKLIDKMCKEDNFRVFIFPYSLNPFEIGSENDYKILQFLGRQNLVRSVRPYMSKPEIELLAENINKITVLSYGPYERINGKTCMCDPFDLDHFKSIIGVLN